MVHSSIENYVYHKRYDVACFPTSCANIAFPNEIVIIPKQPIHHWFAYVQ